MLASASVVDDAQEVHTVVPTEMGDLHGILRVPDGTPLPGLVLVDGSGDGDRNAWGGRPTWLADAGAVVLRHDKPGCGGSPGDWMAQTLHDRARETLDAVRTLRGRPATANQPVGLYGVSQGGWVAMLAAMLEPSAVDFVIVQSTPATTPAAQERDRLERALRREGFEGHRLETAMAWVDERARLVTSDVPIADVLAVQRTHAREPWYAATLDPYDDAPSLRFLRGMLDFDPADVLPYVRCPMLVLLGAADPIIPVRASIEGYSRLLPPNASSGAAVLPDADHGLFVAEPIEGVDRRAQLAPGYLPIVASFLAEQRR